MHQEKNCVPHMHQAETAGRGLQPRPKPLLSDCRTGFATPSETFAFVDMQNIADGVANPVRHIAIKIAGEVIEENKMFI